MLRICSNKFPNFAIANETKAVLFNSIQFAIFLPIVFLLYWFVFDRFIAKSKWQLRMQNAFVVVASYVFYGWWDWRFLLLIAFTSFCSWGSGLLIGKADSKLWSVVTDSDLYTVITVRRSHEDEEVLWNSK